MPAPPPQRQMLLGCNALPRGLSLSRWTAAAGGGKKRKRRVPGDGRERRSRRQISFLFIKSSEEEPLGGSPAPPPVCCILPLRTTDPGTFPIDSSACVRPCWQPEAAGFFPGSPVTNRIGALGAVHVVGVGGAWIGRRSGRRAFSFVCGAVTKCWFWRRFYARWPSNCCW